MSFLRCSAKTGRTLCRQLELWEPRVEDKWAWAWTMSWRLFFFFLHPKGFFSGWRPEKSVGLQKKQRTWPRPHTTAGCSGPQGQAWNGLKDKVGCLPAGVCLRVCRLRATFSGERWFLQVDTDGTRVRMSTLLSSKNARYAVNNWVTARWARSPVLLLREEL